jgi:hypothetical protein
VTVVVLVLLVLINLFMGACMCGRRSTACTSTTLTDGLVFAHVYALYCAVSVVQEDDESGSGGESEEWEPLKRGSSVEYDDASDDSGFADLADLEHSSNGNGSGHEDIGQEDIVMYVLIATDALYITHCTVCINL